MTTSSSSQDARSAVLTSIRENLAASGPFDAVRRGRQGHAEAVAVPNRDASAEPGTLLENFRESLEMVGASCTIVQNEGVAADRIRVIVRDISARNVVISDSELVSRLVDLAGVEAVRNASRAELFSSDVGITSAQWAIAETGTLVLGSGAENHRLISLVPPVHVCVLTADSVRRTMAEILELADPETDRAITFITGASRTSDIELTLAIGVHGPGELHVIVIQNN